MKSTLRNVVHGAIVAGALVPLTACIAESIIALGSVPQIRPVSYVATISADQKAVSFAAVLRNYGVNDSATAFNVRMTVFSENIDPRLFAGAPLPSIGTNTITVPATTVIAGHHGASGSPPGPAVTTASIVGGIAFDPNATYTIRIFVDENDEAFGGGTSLKDRSFEITERLRV